MLFNSSTFALFFAAFYGLYWLCRHSLSARNGLIVAASWLFYGWWDWRFLGLLIASSLLDYRLGIAIEEASGLKRKRFLSLSVCANLGLLGVFKYTEFFVESFAQLIRSLGGTPDWPTLHIILPIGISFYTFQSLGYILDIDNGKVKAARDPLQFLAFVAFFPQLVAGPIERASRLLPQFASPRVITLAGIQSGVWLILIGLFRKVVIADSFGPLANIAFSQDTHTTGSIVLGIIAFAFQIYGDFAGYSDIARGLARLLGFELMENFALPYLATSLRDFWRRWHISLSDWLRDSVYIPLGGNRQGTPKTVRNLMLTMTLGGFWHGADWHFIAWGVWHGLALCCALFFRSITTRLPLWIRWFGVLGVVGFGWLLFRVPDLHSAHLMSLALLEGSRPIWFLSGCLYLLWFGLPAIAIDLAQHHFKSPDWGAYLSMPARILLQGLLVFLIAAAWKTEPSSFIYFQF